MTNLILDDLTSQNKIFDSHCHLNSLGYDQIRRDVIERSVKSGIERIIDIGTDLESSKKAMANAKEFEGNVYAAIGLDPEVCIPSSEMYIPDHAERMNQLQAIKSLCAEENGSVVMIGETGIDLYWNVKNDLEPSASEKSKNDQIDLFVEHIKWANEKKLPLSIHSRNAIDECISCLDENLKPDSEPRKVKAIFHSITPDLDDNEESFQKKLNTIFEHGYSISVNGIVTYKSANLLRNSVLKIIKSKFPNQKYLDVSDFYSCGILFETDGPFLAPEGKRGELNEPANLPIIYDILSKHFQNL